MGWYGWKPYVPVAKRRQQAKKKMDALRKKGVDIQPIEIEGRKIAKTFWGEAWCDHLEQFCDFENRLPRGRTYVRNGSVCHLAIEKGKVEAKVSGSELYNIKVQIKTLPAKKWEAAKQRCSGQIGSLLELLRGNLSDHVMQVVTHPEEGLFPLDGEITYRCDCPDWADMCKHVAAVLYGIGARLDQQPALLFELRGVDHKELIDVDTQAAVPDVGGSGGKRLKSADLGDVFGIDMAADESEQPSGNTSTPKRNAKKTAKAKATTTKKKTPTAKKQAEAKQSALKTIKKAAGGKKKATIAKKHVARLSAKKKSGRKAVPKKAEQSIRRKK